MLTTDDVRAIPLFSTLAEADLERLVRTSADLHLGAGTTTSIDGRRIWVDCRRLSMRHDWRLARRRKQRDFQPRTLNRTATKNGDHVAFGTTFPGGYRAAEPSRVMRVEPRQYYAIAASSPEFAVRVGALVRERIAGLQGITAEPPKTQVTMFGPRWDPACVEMRQFLARNQITHDWLTPDLPDIASLWAGNLPADAECPMLRLMDGTVISKPKLRDVARLLGLQTSARLAEYDTLIIGGGPALQLPCMVRLKACAHWLSSARRLAARPGRRHGSRTISGSPTASPATNLPVARSIRPCASEQSSS